MRKIFFVIFTFCVFMFFACSEEHKNDIAAAKAAKEYYDSLLAGNYAYFVRGMYLADTTVIAKSSRPMPRCLLNVSKRSITAYAKSG